MADLRTRFNRAAMAVPSVQQAAGRGDRIPSGIPRPLTRILGRDNEILTASEMLLAGNAPLVTLTGPGGVGKTRLAQEIALEVQPHFADGVVFVDLSPIQRWSGVLDAIAQALGVRTGDRQSVSIALAAFLRRQQKLLLLDNFEHVLEAAPAIAGLLGDCPALQVLATSRAPLRVRGEQLLTVEPLATPTPGASRDTDQIASTAAVALLLERAQAIDAQIRIVDDNAETFAELCCRLDGLPLAIELAAPRLRVLSPRALLALLDERLRVLRGSHRDAPSRHQTLQSAIGWSYDLLSPDERSAFRGLAVFVGDSTIHRRRPPLAAIWPRCRACWKGSSSRACCSERMGWRESPASACSKPYGSSRPNDCMQRESNRREAHARHFLELPESFARFVYGSEGSSVLAQFEIEYPNLRAALAFFVELGDPESELRLAGVLNEFWLYCGNQPEGIALLTAAVERGASASPAVLGGALMELSHLCHHAGEAECALENGLASLAPTRAGGRPLQTAQALYICALTLGHDHGRWDEAIAMLEEAEHIAPADQPFPTATLGEMYLEIGEIERGADYLERALNLDLANGRHLDAGKELTTLGRVEEARGNPREAARRYADALSQFTIAGAPSLAILALACVCALASDRSLPVTTARLLGMIANLRERLGPAVPRRAMRNLQLAEANARLRLGETQFAESFAAGHSLPISDALAEAEAVADAIASSAEGDRIALADWDQAPQAAHRAHDLTPREMEVLQLMAQRLTDAEIADRLFISYRTVTTHVARICEKLESANRRDAGARAARLGLIQTPGQSDTAVSPAPVPGNLSA